MLCPIELVVNEIFPRLSCWSILQMSRISHLFLKLSDAEVLWDKLLKRDFPLHTNRNLIKLSIWRQNNYTDDVNIRLPSETWRESYKRLLIREQYMKSQANLLIESIQSRSIEEDDDFTFSPEDILDKTTLYVPGMTTEDKDMISADIDEMVIKSVTWSYVNEMMFLTATLKYNRNNQTFEYEIIRNTGVDEWLVCCLHKLSKQYRHTWILSLLDMRNLLVKLFIDRVYLYYIDLDYVGDKVVWNAKSK